MNTLKLLAEIEDGVGISHFNYINYLPDGVHPNALGMSAISKHIFRGIN